MQAADLLAARRTCQAMFSFVLNGEEKEETLRFTHKQITLKLRDAWRDISREYEQRSLARTAARKARLTDDVNASVDDLDIDEEKDEKELLVRQFTELDLQSPDILDGTQPKVLDGEYLSQLDLTWLRVIREATQSASPNAQT